MIFAYIEDGNMKRRK